MASNSVLTDFQCISRPLASDASLPRFPHDHIHMTLESLWTSGFHKTGGNSNTDSWGLWGFIEVLDASANLNFQYVLTIMKYHYYIFKGRVFWNFLDGKHRIINSLYLFMLCQKIDLFSFTISFKMLCLLLCNHILSDKIMPSVTGQVRRKVVSQELLDKLGWKACFC